MVLPPCYFLTRKVTKLGVLLERGLVGGERTLRRLGLRVMAGARVDQGKDGTGNFGAFWEVISRKVRCGSREIFAGGKQVQPWLRGRGGLIAVFGLGRLMVC